MKTLSKKKKTHVKNKDYVDPIGLLHAPIKVNGQNILNNQYSFIIMTERVVTEIECSPNKII